MGWVNDRIERVAKRVGETAADLPIQRAVDIHIIELRELVGIGVTYRQIAEALASTGVVGRRSGKSLSAKALHAMLAKAPDKPPIEPPSDAAISTAEFLPSAAPTPNQTDRSAPPLEPISRRGRGLESLAGRRPK
jgi:hypothetical protein